MPQAADDDDRPLTRRELREELDAALARVFQRLATKDDLRVYFNIVAEKFKRTAASPGASGRARRGGL